MSLYRLDITKLKRVRTSTYVPVSEVDEILAVLIT